MVGAEKREEMSSKPSSGNGSYLVWVLVLSVAVTYTQAL